jgi:hypothetical protein
VSARGTPRQRALLPCEQCRCDRQAEAGGFPCATALSDSHKFPATQCRRCTGRRCWQDYTATGGETLERGPPNHSASSRLTGSHGAPCCRWWRTIG